MRFLGIEIRPAKKKMPPGSLLTDDDRERGMEIRRLSFEKRKLASEIELLELKHQRDSLVAEINEMNGSDEDNVEGMLSTLLRNGLLKAQGVGAVSPPPETANAPRRLSNDELDAVVEKIPKEIKKMLHKKSPEEIRQLAAQYAPTFYGSIDEDTKERLIKILA